jgi:sodium-coupled neutral amino acid transporter 9
MKNNANQEKNNRDLGIAFGLVAATYVLVGAFGYTAYHGATIPQDFLNIFSHTNIPAIVARFALLFQLISVYPLLCMIVRSVPPLSSLYVHQPDLTHCNRIQFFGLLFKSNYPGWLHVLIMNLVIAAVTTLMAMFYPNVGTILRFV